MDETNKQIQMVEEKEEGKGELKIATFPLFQLSLLKAFKRETKNQKHFLT